MPALLLSLPPEGKKSSNGQAQKMLVLCEMKINNIFPSFIAALSRWPAPSLTLRLKDLVSGLGAQYL